MPRKQWRTLVRLRLRFSRLPLPPAMLLRRTAIPMLIALPLALAACAGDPSGHQASHPRREPRPDPQADVPLQTQSFEVAGRPIRLVRKAAAPTQTPTAMVVYLPGLGEGTEAGQRWQAAWAAAGYWVLTIQPVQADAEAWRSPLARSGEFQELGRLHHGEAAQRERLVALQRLLASLRQSANPPWSGLDWSQTVLAGYDIGAQTVLDWPADSEWQPRALIAISPPPMTPTASLPTLLITSDQDGDPLGLIARPAERRRSFEAMAPGRAWLLQLDNVSHAGLAGNRVSEAWAAQDQHRGGMGPGQGSGSGGAGRGRGGADGMAGGQRGPGAGTAHGPRSGSATEAAQADLGEGLRSSAAFLDAMLRGATWPTTATRALQAR